MIRTATGETDRTAGRAAAKSAVGDLFDASPGDVRLEHRSGAAPLVRLRDERSRTARPRVGLSISHRDGRAVAVATRRRLSLGVDLERENSVDPSHARYFLSATELDRPTVHSSTALWVLKEAAWKALRCGRNLPFASLQVLFDAAGRVHAVALHGIRRRAVAKLWHPWPGWLAAVVVVRDFA